MDLVERVRNILVNPKQEWLTIAPESATVHSLYVGYIMILAAIEPLAIVLRGLGFGSALSLPLAIGTYVLSLVAVSIVALIVDLLAPSFGGQRDFVASLKLTAYSYTAVWIAGIFMLVPTLGGIVGLLAGLYSIYTFYLGAPPIKKCPADKAVAYTIIVLICNIVLLWLVRLMALPMVGGGIGGLGTMGMVR
jgi:hypothetical protein